MICKVLSTVKKYEMFRESSTVIVAVSGGADSMALLSVLNSIKDVLGLKIIAAHVNHCFRGAESDRDEDFVKAFCKDNSIELHVLKKDVNALSKKSGIGFEECGRQVRYDFFNSIYDNSLIATAHTINDRLETMLFNLSRGSTLKGLCSIPAVRGNIIRPLIDCTRDEVEEYCANNNIQFVTDSTNSDTQYARNRIRHNVIPELKKINQSLESAAQKCISSLNDDEDFLTIQTKKLLSDAKIGENYSAQALKNAHTSIRKRALACILRSATGELPLNNHIEAVDELLIEEGKQQVITGAAVCVKNGLLSVFYEKKQGEKWCVEIDGENVKIPFGTAKISIVYKKDSENTQKVNKEMLDNCFDYDKITGKLFVRSRVDGERVLLCGRDCVKTLKKLFNENHIPVNERNDVVVVSDDVGIVWLEGFGCAQRCKICDDTKKMAIVEIGRD